VDERFAKIAEIVSGCRL